MATPNKLKNKEECQMSPSSDKGKQSDNKTQQTLFAVRRSRHCLLCFTADNVYCVTQKTASAASHGIQCLLRHTEVSVCCVT